MDYLIDEDGIHFFVEEYPPKPARHALPDAKPAEAGPDDIPMAEALVTVSRIAQGIEAMYDEGCECLQQGAQPCGACGRPPARRT